MRAAIFRKGEIVVDKLPEPTPGHGQVLAKTLACGICGSDLHARVHAERMNAALKHVPWRKGMDLTRDIVFGHEYCCEILDHGPGCDKRFKVGARVVSVPRMMVDGALQGIGYSNENVGGYAERMLLGESFLLEVPNGLASDHAALTEPLAVGMHAVAKARIDGGEVPLVVGCGPVGLAVIAALKRKRRSVNLGPIVAADYSPRRRALAQRMGADVVVDPAAASPFQTWEEHARLTPAELATLPPLLATLTRLKPALVFECVGVPGMIQMVFERAPQDARVIVVGVCMETDRQEPLLAIFKELNLQYVLAYTADEFADALRLLAEGDVEAEALVTGRVGLDGVAERFAALASPERHVKIMIEPWRI